ncbi:MAG: carboxy terminal-processing peptidase [Kiritimatiellia bacterium]|jgi:C-terminal peptidase prc
MKRRPKFQTAWMILILGGLASIAAIDCCKALSGSLAQNGAAADYYGGETAADTDASLQTASTVARLLVNDLPEIHLLHQPFDAAMSAVAWTNYLNSLDYERMFFLQSDIDEFEHAKTLLPQWMRAGEVSFAKDVFERFRERVRDRAAFVQANATNAFDYAGDGTFALNRKDLPWPADAEEMDALWLDRILNSLIAHQVSARIASDKNIARAAKLRIDIARCLHDPDASADDVAESALAAELQRLDDALAALPSTPTNVAQRIAFREALCPSPQQATNDVVEADAPVDATGSSREENDDGNMEDEEEVVPTAPTTRLDNLIASFFSARRGIKTAEEARADAIEKTVKNCTQYESILMDSDQEYYLSRFFNAVTTSYDPHSAYLSPVAQEDFGIDMQLSLQGIGATLQTDDGTAKIVEIIPGSPAERDTSETRLVPGDKIIAVAQGDEEFVDIRHWPLYKAVRLIRGPKGSTVRLQVIPANDANAIKTVVLVRDEIKLEEQAATSRIETVTGPDGETRKLGYIKLPTFYSSMKLGADPDATQRSATLDVARLVSELNAENVEGLVFDLRGNGGGSLPESIYLAGLFFRSGPVVQVRETRRTITLNDNDPAIAFTKPMVVLIDRISASASEIVAGALQDYGRAVIVGDSHSHGKGTVQTLVPMRGGGNNGSIKATTASFYRVTGSSTQMRGVSSDIRLPSVFEYYSELGEDKLPNAMPWTRTGPARYRRTDTLDETIPLLAKRSAERLATNERWQKHIQLLERFGAFSTNRVVSLNFEKRLQRAQEDEALSRELSLETPVDESGSLDPVGGDREEDRPKTKAERERKARQSDVVLDESLNILVDLIDLHGPPRNLHAQESPYDFLNFFFQ